MNPLSPLGQKGIAPIAIALILLAIAGGVILFSNRAPDISPPLIPVYDYDSCVRATQGVIMPSLPPQCKAPDGRIFVQPIEVNDYDSCVKAGFPIYKKIPPYCQTPDGQIFEQGKNPNTIITNYQQCVAAGYPIMESYPPQCRVPGGPNFFEEITTYEQCVSAGYATYKDGVKKTEICLAPGEKMFFNPFYTTDTVVVKNFEDCARYYKVLESNPRLCRDPEGNVFSEKDAPAVSKYFCEKDSDCRIIRENDLTACCVQHCGVIDYSQEEWITVNSNWATADRFSRCPDTACPPWLPCMPAVENTKYVGRCEQNTCQKRPVVVPEPLITAHERDPEGWNYYSNVTDEVVCTYIGGAWDTTMESPTIPRCLIFG